MKTEKEPKLRCLDCCYIKKHELKDCCVWICPKILECRNDLDAAILDDPEYLYQTGDCGWGGSPKVVWSIDDKTKLVV